MRLVRSYCSRHPVVILAVLAGLVVVVLTVKRLTETSHQTSVSVSRYVYMYLGHTKSHTAPIQVSDVSRDRSTNFPTLTEESLLSDIQNITSKLKKCFEATNLTLFDGLSEGKAKKSVDNYVREFRKVIPMTFQPNCAYPSHCWKVGYDVKTKDRHVWGHIGSVTFDEVVADDYRASHLKDVQNTFHNHFSSQTVCLPNLFLLGFPKCGSTFLWCLIERVVNATIGVRPAAFKEPGWWSERHNGLKKLNASELGRYFANFAAPIRAVETSGQVNIVLAEGTPGMAYAIPRFSPRAHPQVNYCLLPVVIPHFLPHAKFIMIMREPADALYSLFWWACKGRLTNRTQRGIPNAFHKGVMQKVDVFNKCMRDEKIKNISHACSLSASDYSSCITHPKRLPLLDKCVDEMTTSDFSAHGVAIPRCAKIGFNMYMYFVHVRRWLSVIPREKFYFLTLDDTSDPVTVARSIFKLMNIPLSSDFDTMAKMTFSECQKRKNTQKISYSDNASLQMRKDTRSKLKKFFAPFNKMLSELLDDSKFLFNDI